MPSSSSSALKLGVWTLRKGGSSAGGGVAGSVMRIAPDGQGRVRRTVRNSGQFTRPGGGLQGSSAEVRGDRHRGVGGDVDPDVDVRVAAEVPDEGRPLDAPVVPLALRAQRPL